MKQSKEIDNFIKKFPKTTQTILRNIRKAIQIEAPEAEESMVYGIPSYKLGGKNLVHFSAFAKHVGFYPTPDAITKFKKELSKYKTAKGSAQFPLDQPIPYDLIKRMTAFRVKQLS